MRNELWKMTIGPELNSLTGKVSYFLSVITLHGYVSGGLLVPSGIPFHKYKTHLLFQLYYRKDNHLMKEQILEFKTNFFFNRFWELDWNPDCFLLSWVLCFIAFNFLLQVAYHFLRELQRSLFFFSFILSVLSLS